MATPRELLEEVKKRFLTLLVENQKTCSTPAH